jgi:putative molybdopterin biosynthesis protein
MSDRKIFRELVTVEEAFQKFFEVFEPKTLGFEQVSLRNLLGRIVSANLYAKVDVPSFNRSMMDGYAVRHTDTVGADEATPKDLQLIGTITTGSVPKGEVNPGTAFEISTGAALPKGANAVVMVEYTKRDEKSVLIFRPSSPGENIVYAASDLSKGQLILPRGTQVTPRDIGAIAASGYSSIEVHRKPRVGIISTGDEIIPPNKKLKDAQVFDINSYTIALSVIESGGDPVLLGIATDSEKDMRIILTKAVKETDLVVTSGSTSAGVGDTPHKIIDTLGPPGVIVHGVAMKPGKPLILAVLEGIPFIGLPGYPTSALSVFNVFASTIIRQMAGVKTSPLETIIGENVLPIQSVKGRREYLPVTVIKSNYRNIIIPSYSGSSAITSLSESDGFITIPEDTVLITPDSKNTVHLFGRGIKPVDVLIAGSQSLAQEVALDIFRDQNPNLKVRNLILGSTGGVKAVREKLTDIASIHVLDPHTRTYNIPLIKKFGLQDQTVLVKFLKRTQGLLVRKGNPKKIKDMNDLVREEISFVNRNPGSGTRILLDLKLDDLEIPIKERQIINGYWVEMRTHQAVASAVKYGRADVGLGTQTAAIQSGLDFLPIAEEEYDFLIRKSKLDNPIIKTFLDVLQSKEIESQLKMRYPWLKLAGNIGRPLKM